MKLLLAKITKNLMFYSRRGLQWLRGIVWPLVGRRLQRPVFVVGCSRAGTTLLYKLLSQAPELRSLNRETHDVWIDLHPLAEREWSSHALGSDHASDVDRDAMSRYFYRHLGNRRVVDKNNQNGLCIPYLHALFPDATFVYVKRSPGDNINSLMHGWGKAQEFGTWADTLPENVQISGGRYQRWCFFLAEGWRNLLSAEIETVCAFQYRTMNEAIMLAGAAIPSSQWVEIKYEDLVANADAELAAIFRACGVHYSDALQAACKKTMATPFNEFSEIRLDKWKSGAHTQQIEQVLGEVSAVAHQMGYFEQ
ncbi:MAG TPA: sulfotransferase [Chromatiaceae bacterium]|jgi:hypothetical protein|nr:sulfotransferase [Chromatiaceae bacterium]HIN81788.1 sulfotransferase [Chromatiales bacterium]HIO54473.1 sulfotransferase [Chromatiales bacterium]